MKLEIYRFEVGSTIGLGRTLEYMIFLNNKFMGTNTLDTPTQIEDTDKLIINNILNNLANNMDEVITRVINAPPNRYLPHGNCIYTSSSDKVLKELDIKLKMKEIEGDFK